MTFAKIEQSKFSEQTIYMPKIADIASCAEHLMPLKEWESAFLSDFSELRLVSSHLLLTTHGYVFILFAKGFVLRKALKELCMWFLLLETINVYFLFQAYKLCSWYFCLNTPSIPNYRIKIDS